MDYISIEPSPYTVCESADNRSLNIMYSSMSKADLEEFIEDADVDDGSYVDEYSKEGLARNKARKARQVLIRANISVGPYMVSIPFYLLYVARKYPEYFKLFLAYYKKINDLIKKSKYIVGEIDTYLNKSDYLGLTLLHHLATMETATIELLEACMPVDINAECDQKRTPLSLAVSTNNKLVARWLIEKGANAEHPSVDNSTLTLMRTNGVRRIEL